MVYTLSPICQIFCFNGVFMPCGYSRYENQVNWIFAYIKFLVLVGQKFFGFSQDIWDIICQLLVHFLLTKQYDANADVFF